MIKPNSLLFGTAGIPISSKKKDTIGGIERVRELNLDAMELEFVHSINISKEKAPEVRKTINEKNVLLTCHAPYFINLNAVEPEKKHASINRILKSAEILSLANGYSVCFHPGFYLNMEKEKVFETIKENIKKIRKEMDENNYDVYLRPETTGKETQFGDLIELLKISQEVNGVMPVIDFSHLHARTNGKYNTYEEFKEILENVEKYLGKEGLNNMHIHLSGINYGEKGEKNHLVLEESDLNYKELIKTWKEFKIKGVVISESPNIEEDALLMKKTYENL
ncbi:MAG: TIM barrel protein [Candidatus Woesearchaeota archaeon]